MLDEDIYSNPNSVFLQINTEEMNTTICNYGTKLTLVKSLVYHLSQLFHNDQECIISDEFYRTIEKLNEKPQNLYINPKHINNILSNLFLNINEQTTPYKIHEILKTVQMLLIAFDLTLNIFFENNYFVHIQRIFCMDDSIVCDVSEIFACISALPLSQNQIEIFIEHFKDISIVWMGESTIGYIRGDAIRTYGHLMLQNAQFENEFFLSIISRLSDFMLEDSESIFSNVCWAFSNIFYYTEIIEEESLVKIFNTFWTQMQLHRRNWKFDNDQTRFLNTFVSKIFAPIDSDLYRIIDLEWCIETAKQRDNRLMLEVLSNLLSNEEEVDILIKLGIIDIIYEKMSNASQLQEMCLKIASAILENGCEYHIQMVIKNGFIQQALEYVCIVQNDISCAFLKSFARSICVLAQKPNNEFSIQSISDHFIEQGIYQQIQSLLETDSEEIYFYTTELFKILFPEENI